METLFAVGDLVVFDRDQPFTPKVPCGDKEPLRILKVIPVPPNQRRDVSHSQWVEFADADGTAVCDRHKSLPLRYSGAYFKKADLLA